jgi:hypothetical protein
VTIFDVIGPLFNEDNIKKIRPEDEESNVDEYVNGEEGVDVNGIGQSEADNKCNLF